MEIEAKWAHKLFMNKLKGICINQLNVEKVIQERKVRENDKGRFYLGLRLLRKKKFFSSQNRFSQSTDKPIVSVVF